MKKVIPFIAAFVLLLYSFNLKSQITLDFKVDTSIYGYYFYPTKISANETKWVFLDTATNTFSLFNLDMTPFLTSVQLPHPIYTVYANGAFFYHIMYITRSLFDCDSTTVEFMYASQNEPFNPLWIMRTDGTILFQADSARGPYCLGCPGGTILHFPVFSTEEGTKMVIMKSQYGAHNYGIYSLCGSLPNGYHEFDFTTSQRRDFVSVFPNPSSMLINFEINLPDNIHTYELAVFNNSAQELRRERLWGTGNRVEMDMQQYSSGLYHYHLISNGNIVQSGKFLVTK